MAPPHEALPSLADRRQVSRLPSALDEAGGILELLIPARPVLFLDYDGTLTPIVRRPEDALLDESTRSLVRRLATLFPVAIISGRDRRDVENLVGIDTVFYAGSHGFDIRGPGGLRFEQPGASALLPRLEAAEHQLRADLVRVDGALVERKRFSVAVHFRNVVSEHVPHLRQCVDRTLGAAPGLRKTAGKMVLELRPDVDWDKGRAVSWLLGALPADDRATVPVYIGDDLTDEDALRRLAPPAIGIIAGPGHDLTFARYRLPGTSDVTRFLDLLASNLGS